VLAPTERFSAAPRVTQGSLEIGREIFDPKGPFIAKDELARLFFRFFLDERVCRRLLDLGFAIQEFLQTLLIRDSQTGVLPDVAFYVSFHENEHNGI
jgi:hypothetical protein